MTQIKDKRSKSRHGLPLCPSFSPSASISVICGFLKINYSVEMRIDHCANQAVQGEGQPRKKYIMKPRNVVTSHYPFIRHGVKPEIFERFFLRPPGELESPQALVSRRGSTEMEGVKSVLCQKLYGFPHDKIVPAKVLVPLVGGPELVNSLCPRVEEDCRGNGCRTLVRENNKAQSGLDDLVVNSQEERRRLRRETMPPPRPDV
jgi:hypothetical protein